MECCSVFLLVVILFEISTAFPAENVNISSRIDLGLGAVVNKQAGFPGVILDQKANIINQGTAVINQKTNAIQQKSASFSVLANLVPERPKGREQAFFSTPTKLNQKDSIYDGAQRFVASIFHPKPIVDTISEDEKYGNTGDHFRSFGNAVVNGYEGFSNLLNAAAELPFSAMKQATRKASSYLSTLGATLVGL